VRQPFLLASFIPPFVPVFSSLGPKKNMAEKIKPCRQPLSPAFLFKFQFGLQALSSSSPLSGGIFLAFPDQPLALFTCRR